MSILNQIVAGDAPNIVPLTTDQYHQMLATGILRDGESIELIDGILVRKDRADKGGDPMSHGPNHAYSVKRLQRLLRVVETQGYHLHSQLPVTLGGTQEPEPDLAVIRGPEEDYGGRHPGPGDIAGIMEVADSSLVFDRTTKQRLYAVARIPIYWIVNLVERQVEVYEEPLPADGKYARCTVHAAGHDVTLTLEAAFEVKVSVSDLLPSQPQ